ncbi:flavodoxin [uncultured Helicobacter sp.]|uniref:flavodoxin n=1 Tax=uncultured Helicobacter sp. TaxID=175537 RepID=UPI002615068E|nr:flavodoxin [uncultured Helicobacter sp.]
MKALVAFFSASGITREIALALAEVADAKLYEIIPAEPYSQADLDWRDEQSRSTKECKDKASRPQIAKSIEISSYDTIFIGFPIWWYSAPQIIFTFLESHDFSGKTIVPFCTSGGSDLSNAPRDMAKCAPNAIFKEGRRFNFGTSKAKLKKWLEGLGIA